jgi:hypothetical protein
MGSDAAATTSLTTFRSQCSAGVLVSKILKQECVSGQPRSVTSGRTMTEAIAAPLLNGGVGSAAAADDDDRTVASVRR